MTDSDWSGGTIDWGSASHLSNKNETTGTWFNFTLEAQTAKKVFLMLNFSNLKSGEYSSTLTATNNTEVA